MYVKIRRHQGLGLTRIKSFVVLLLFIGLGLTLIMYRRSEVESLTTLALKRIGNLQEMIRMYVQIRRHQHTRVHAHKGPWRHTRARVNPNP